MLSLILPDGRWKLLKALWLDGERGSVHSLAKRNSMSYSNAHAELERLERASLASADQVGNSRLFRANLDHPAARAVGELVRASAEAENQDRVQVSDDEILANLASHGAPLRIETVASNELDLEESVAQGLRLSHRLPIVARALPVLLARNRHRLDMTRIEGRAAELGEKRALGFFLQLCPRNSVVT